MERYTACVVGLGRIAFTLGFDKLREQPASHTMALLNNHHIHIVAGCDSEEEKRTAWQRYVSRHQHESVAVYANACDMLAKCRADIVVVAVNEASHTDVAMCAIEAVPRLVILEKPVALDSKEGERIREAATNRNVPVMINHERRFAEDYRIAKEYIASGNIGDVQSVTAELESSLRVYSPSEDRTGAYSLLHDGTHLVDITRFLLGDACLTHPRLINIVHDDADKRVVRNISMHFATEAQSGVENMGDAAIQCPDVLIKISGRSAFFHFGLEVLGTKGRVRVGNGFAQFEKREESSLYTGFYSLARDKSVRVPRKTRYFSNMVQCAVDYLDGRKPLASTLQDALLDLKVLEEMKTFCDGSKGSQCF